MTFTLLSPFLWQLVWIVCYVMCGLVHIRIYIIHIALIRSTTESVVQSKTPEEKRVIRIYTLSRPILFVAISWHDTHYLMLATSKITNTIDTRTHTHLLQTVNPHLVSIAPTITNTYTVNATKSGWPILLPFPYTSTLHTHPYSSPPSTSYLIRSPGQSTIA